MPDQAPALLSLPMQRWLLRLRLARPLAMAHAGSMLRGAFGHALKSLACDCTGALHQACLYQRIFEPSPLADWPSRYQNCPPAFVLTAPWLNTPTSQVDFACTLLGPAVQAREVFWQAWQRAARQGFGSERIRADIDLVDAPKLYQPEVGQYLGMQLLSPLLLKRKTPGQTHSQALTPSELQLKDLLVAVHRRLQLTQQLYAVPKVLPALDSWLAQVTQITLHSQLRACHFARHSNRQQQRMPLYGLLGHLHLHGPLSEDLREALVLGQWLHIGGKTALGLGGYRLQASPLTLINGDQHEANRATDHYC